MTARPLVLPLDEFALLKRLLAAFTGSEDAVVVRPGETLIIRVPDSWTPAQLREYNDGLAMIADEVPFGLLAVVGDELAVARGGDA